MSVERILSSTEGLVIQAGCHVRGRTTPNMSLGRRRDVLSEEMTCESERYSSPWIRRLRLTRVKLTHDTRWIGQRVEEPPRASPRIIFVPGVSTVDRVDHCLQAFRVELEARNESSKRSWPSTPSAPTGTSPKHNSSLSELS